LTDFNLWYKYAPVFKNCIHIVPLNDRKMGRGVMDIYIRCRQLFAVYLEFSRALGARPFFSLNTCNGESIMDIPYGQIIITPGKRLRAEAGKKGNEERDRQIAVAAARLTEDRS
jgi:hypothetical protein